MRHMTIGRNLLLFFTWLASSAVWAGVNTGGGGDLSRLYPELKAYSQTSLPGKKNQLKGYLENSIRQDLLGLLKQNSRQFYQSLRWADKEYPGILKFLSKKPQELEAEILKSKYVIKDSGVYFPYDCRQRACEVDAQTDGISGAPIVFNLSRLASYNASPEQMRSFLWALAFHEHVRNLGFKDDNHVLGKSAAKVEGFVRFRKEFFIDLKKTSQGSAIYSNTPLMEKLYELKRMGFSSAYWGMDRPNPEITHPRIYLLLWHPTRHILLQIVGGFIDHPQNFFPDRPGSFVSKPWRAGFFTSKKLRFRLQESTLSKDPGDTFLEVFLETIDKEGRVIDAGDEDQYLIGFTPLKSFR